MAPSASYHWNSTGLAPNLQWVRSGLPHWAVRYSTTGSPLVQTRWRPLLQTTGSPLVLHPTYSGSAVGCPIGQLGILPLVAHSCRHVGANCVSPLEIHWSCTQLTVGVQWAAVSDSPAFSTSRPTAASSLPTTQALEFNKTCIMNEYCIKKFAYIT